jgi:hypothetical protein
MLTTLLLSGYYGATIAVRVSKKKVVLWDKDYVKDAGRSPSFNIASLAVAKR